MVDDDQFHDAMPPPKPHPKFGLETREGSGKWKRRREPPDDPYEPPDEPPPDGPFSESG